MTGGVHSPTRRSVFAWSLAITAVGALLRARQYFAQSSLWLDEAALARNIVGRSFAHLIEPLDYAQVAAPGFLWLERAVVLAFGPTELALRLIPFAASVATIPLFASLARRVLPYRSALLAAWLFALAVPMVFFSATVKPYSVDVLAAVTVATVAVEATRDSLDTRQAVRIGALGVLAWFSNVTPIVLAATGLGLVTALALQRKAALRPLAVIIALWSALAGPAVLFAMRNVRSEDSAYLHRRWAGAFVPHSPGAIAHWSLATLYDFVGHPGTWELNGSLQYGWGSLFLILMILGAWWMWRSQKHVILLLLFPPLVTAIASALGLYPFTGRFIIFLIPSFVLLTAAGTLQAGRLGRARWLGVLAASVVGILSVRAVIVTHPPRRPEDLKPVLESVARQRQPGDLIYVYYAAGQAFLFYKPRMPFAPGTFVIGRCAREHPDWLIDDVEALPTAPRLWVVISHAVNAAAEIAALVHYLQGTRGEIAHVLPPGGQDAEAYLFASRSKSAAERPHITAPRALSWECGGPANPASFR